MNQTDESYAQTACIYPVILAVPKEVRSLKGRNKVMGLSRHARRALDISAVKSHVRPGSPLKDANGVPIPFEGNYWSLTHKPAFVGGVVAPIPIGIDLEEIKAVSAAMFRKIASEREWSLCSSNSCMNFYRYWTAKEAVLKAAGIGMKGLSACRIEKIADETHVTVDYKGRLFSIEHFQFHGHIAAVVDNGCRVEWTLD
jgi:4'-phosphopantetheinyl transferase